MSNEQALREAAGIERAAAWIDKRRNGYMDEHGSHDPETGGTDLSRAGQEYVGELDEIAEGLRSLLPCDRPPSGWYCTRQRGHAGPCAALALPASAHGAEPSDLAHELWAAAQLAPGEGIADSVSRIEAILRRLHGAEPSDASREDIADHVVQMVCDMDDRSSPEDQPEMMLVTGPELHEFVLTALEGAALAAAQAAQAGAVPEGCNHDWQPFYTGPTQTHVICARCDLMRSAPAQPDAARLIEAALAWWEGNRPTSMSAEQHRASPATNCAGSMEEADLAVACGEFDATVAAQPDAADAARYRWLRTYPNNIGGAVYGPRFDPMCGGLLRRAEYLDSAIDAALAAQAVAKGGEA